MMESLHADLFPPPTATDRATLFNGRATRAAVAMIPKGARIMRYQISGVDRNTGESLTLRVNAPNQDAALEQAYAQEVMVSDVQQLPPPATVKPAQVQAPPPPPDPVDELAEALAGDPPSVAGRGNFQGWGRGSFRGPGRGGRGRSKAGRESRVWGGLILLGIFLVIVGFAIIPAGRGSDVSGAVLVLVILGFLLVGFWLVYAPARIAKRRGHKNAQAIKVCALCSLLVPALWAVALVWAYTGPDHGKAGGRV